MARNSPEYGDYEGAGGELYAADHPEARPAEYEWLRTVAAQEGDPICELVCAVTAPEVPYMRDLIAEPGADTLPEYRRREYANRAVGAFLKRVILKEKKAPIWSTSAGNIASQKLADVVAVVR